MDLKIYEKRYVEFISKVNGINLPPLKAIRLFNIDRAPKEVIAFLNNWVNNQVDELYLEGNVMLN